MFVVCGLFWHVLGFKWFRFGCYSFCASLVLGFEIGLVCVGIVDFVFCAYLLVWFNYCFWLFSLMICVLQWFDLVTCGFWLLDFAWCVLFGI